MAESRRLRWPYPNQYVDPWYDAFESLVDAMDASAYTVREDRSSVLMSTATVSFNVSGADGVLTWNAPIELLAPLSGFLLSVSAGTATLRDGELLYMQVVRAPTANITVSFNVARAVPNTDDCLLMAIRRGSTVYWRDGKVINHGESVQLFSTSGGGGGGGAFIKQDGTNSPTADIPWNGFKITGLGAPVAALDAATKKYVDEFLRRDGANSPSADIPWNAKKITNLANPVAPQDAATKAYVDAVGGGVLATGTTTNATPLDVYTQAVAPDSVAVLEVTVAANSSAAGQRAAYVMIATVYRVGVGVATLLGAVTVVHQRESDPAWDADVIVSGTNAVVRVTGAALTNINWTVVTTTTSAL